MLIYSTKVTKYQTISHYMYYFQLYLWLKLKRLKVVMLRGSMGRCWSARCL